MSALPQLGRQLRIVDRATNRSVGLLVELTRFSGWLCLWWWWAQRLWVFSYLKKSNHWP